MRLLFVFLYMIFFLNYLALAFHWYDYLPKPDFMFKRIVVSNKITVKYSKLSLIYGYFYYQHKHLVNFFYFFTPLFFICLQIFIASGNLPFNKTIICIHIFVLISSILISHIVFNTVSGAALRFMFYIESGDYESFNTKLMTLDELHLLALNNSTNPDLSGAMKVFKNKNDVVFLVTYSPIDNRLMFAINIHGISKENINDPILITIGNTHLAKCLVCGQALMQHTN